LKWSHGPREANVIVRLFFDLAAFPARLGASCGLPWRRRGRQTSRDRTQQYVEWLSEVTRDFAVVGDADLGEQRLVELATNRIGCGCVGRLGVGSESQRVSQVLVDEFAGGP
jgi:hypothetical protein